MAKRAMVTGGSGFIGGHLQRVLRGRGYETVSFDQKSGHDIRDRDDLASELPPCDVVFNLAGVLGTHELNRRDQIQEAIDVNVKGTVNVLDVAAEHDVNVVQIGKPNPWLNTYSITKQAEEQFAKLYQREHDTDTWLVRWYNVYGPGQKYGTPQKLVPTALVHALKDHPIEIFGDGTALGTERRLRQPPHVVPPGEQGPLPRLLGAGERRVVHGCVGPLDGGGDRHRGDPRPRADRCRAT